MIIKLKYWKDDGSEITPKVHVPAKIYSRAELQELVGNDPVQIQRALDAQALQEKLNKALAKVAPTDCRPVKRMPSWMR